MIVKSKIKKVFKEHGVQIPISTLNILDEELRRQVYKWARAAKNGNIKRLNPNDVWLVLGNAWKKIIG